MFDPTASRHSASASTRAEASLLALHPGEGGKICKIDAPDLEMALLKMGVTVGDQVSFSGTAPLRDPVAIRVHRTKILLRRDDASHIWISKS